MLGETIQKIRKELNLTQKELADRIGVTSNFMSMIEKNRRTPGNALLDKISEELKVPKPYLLISQIRPELDKLEDPAVIGFLSLLDRNVEEIIRKV